jgi:alpha-amylase
MKWTSSLLPLSLSLSLLLLGQAAHALTPAEWRSQSIYFLLTDRFGREDNSTTAACNVTQRVCALSSLSKCMLTFAAILRW